MGNEYYNAYRMYLLKVFYSRLILTCHLERRVARYMLALSMNKAAACNIVSELIVGK